MMVDDDDIKTEISGRRDFRSVRDTAIHRDQQINAALSEPPEPFGIEAVTFFDAVRHMVDRLGADFTQKRNEH